MRGGLFLLALILGSSAVAQRATAVRIVTGGRATFWGDVYATINGKARKVASNASGAWLAQGGRIVLYSGQDGAGGFENEGQSIWSVDLQTGRRRKLMAEDTMVTRVREARSRRGRTAYLVELEDGGLGAPHVAVLHPQRGQVYRRGGARFAGVTGGTLRIADYRWKALEENVGKAKPYRYLRYDLDALLVRPTIRNHRRGGS